MCPRNTFTMAAGNNTEIKAVAATTKADSDLFYMNKNRGTPQGNAKGGYKDLLFIEAAEEAFKEGYIRIVMKGIKNKDDEKSAQRIGNFYVLLTKFVNKLNTTTPLNPDKNCLTAKNFTINVKTNIGKIIEDKSGVRETKSNSQIAFYIKFKTMCIDDIHHDAWNSFYDEIECIIGDDPSTTSAFKSKSLLSNVEQEKLVVPKEPVAELPVKRKASSLPPSSSLPQSVVESEEPLVTALNTFNQYIDREEQRANEEHELKLQLMKAQLLEFERKNRASQ